MAITLEQGSSAFYCCVQAYKCRESDKLLPFLPFPDSPANVKTVNCENLKRHRNIFSGKTKDLMTN